MPEATSDAPTTSDANLHPQMPAVETRLAPDQLAELDAMNAAAWGEPLPPTQPAQSTQPVPPAEFTPPPPPVEKPAEKPVEIPAPPPNDFIPPTDLESETAPIAEQSTDELPEGKSIFSDDAIEKLRTEKHKGDVKTLRDNYDKTRGVLKEREAQLAEMQKKVASPNEEVNARIADLEERNRQLNTIVEKHAIKEQPWYLENISQPRDMAWARAERALEMAEIAPDTLRRALSLDGKAKINALDELNESISSPTLRQRVDKAVAEIENLNDQDAAFLANRDGNFARMAQQEKANRHRQLAEQEKNYTQALDKTFDYLGEKMGSFFKKSGKPEHAKWDEAFASDMQEAREISLRNEDPMKLLSVVALGVRTPRIVAAYKTVLGMLQTERAENAKLRGSVPSLNGHNVSSGERTEASINPNEDLAGAGLRAIREVSSDY